MIADPDFAAARRAQIAANLAEVRRRVGAACQAAGRDPREVTLIAVTKTFPASDVVHLAALGVGDVGENREREAHEKFLASAELGLRWHFVGQLQTNKVNRLARYIDAVHSVDRVELVSLLDASARRYQRRLSVFVQVSLAPAAHRGGAAPETVGALADAVAGAEQLDLVGVMAVAPLGQPPEIAFEQLARMAAAVRASYPLASAISAGMSDDYETAVGYGATHIRLGTALLGSRPREFG
ncbi:MAG: YggS family pyridoxal phosphate-dependent enzyme [Mycobacteriales bacterium]